ncbi:hypothetical protein [Streptomyces sp. NPDC020362]|uniref:hypothetical protein n=1 Tax=unclassified Streptomyces TaxID=2593676 RepID=UPI0033ED5146
MNVELARTAIGFIAALTVPTAFSWHRTQPWRAIAFTLTYGAFVVAPSGVTLKEAIASACITSVSVCFALLSRPASWKLPNLRSAWQELRSWWVETLQPTGAQYTAATIGIFSILLPIALGFRTEIHWIHRSFVDDDRFAVTLSGLLIAVFGCQQIIGKVIRPFIEKIRDKIRRKEFDESIEEFIKVGPHVGWIERFILFAFLVSGNPAAAALVVTAKSLARFPEIQQAEKLVGDYYLVGTLTSVAVALATSSVTRMALGMPPI